MNTNTTGDLSCLSSDNYCGRKSIGLDAVVNAMNITGAKNYQ